MRKKVLIISLVIVVLGLLAGFTIPVLANAGEKPGQDAWQEMHEACQNGDGQAMTDAAPEFHGGDFNNMPCGGSVPPVQAGQSGPTVSGGGMMGPGGMMGGWGSRTW